MKLPRRRAGGWERITAVRSIKKIATMAKETVLPEIGRTMSGNIFGAAPRVSNKRRSKKARPKRRGATKIKDTPTKSTHNKKTPQAKIQYTFYINGRKFEARSAINALKQIFEYLPRIDPQFLEKFDSLEHGKKRRYISRDRTKTISQRFPRRFRARYGNTLGAGLVDGNKLQHGKHKAHSSAGQRNDQPKNTPYKYRATYLILT